MVRSTRSSSPATAALEDDHHYVYRYLPFKFALLIFPGATYPKLAGAGSFALFADLCANNFDVSLYAIFDMPCPQAVAVLNNGK